MIEKITRHAVSRSKQRLGINRKSLERTFEIAKQKGLRHHEATGKLRKYLDYRSITCKFRSTTHIVYAEHIFVVCGDALVTVLYIPKRFLKSARAQINKKNSKN